MRNQKFNWPPVSQTNGEATAAQIFFEVIYIWLVCINVCFCTPLPSWWATLCSLIYQLFFQNLATSTVLFCHYGLKTFNSGSALATTICNLFPSPTPLSTVSYWSLVFVDHKFGIVGFLVTQKVPISLTIELSVAG